MNKRRIFVVAIAAILCASVAFAQANESLVEKLRKKFNFGAKPAAPAAQTAAKTAVKAPAAPVKPVETPAAPKVVGATLAQTTAAEPKETAETAVKAQKAAETPAVKPAKDTKDMTKEELIVEITKMLSSSRSVAAAVPEIQISQDKKGVETYMYKKADGTTAPLSSLDKAALEALYLRIRNEFMRVQNDRTMKMLRDIKNIERMNQQQRMLRDLNRRPTTTYKSPVPPNPTRNIPKTTNTRTYR